MMMPPKNSRNYGQLKQIQIRKTLLKFDWGIDFGAPHETALTSLYEKPVFVYGYPTVVKAFYMEPWPGRPEICKSVDLLAPEGYGEIIGGSERMSSPELLLQRIHEHKLPEEALEWYLDLRRYGSTSPFRFRDGSGTHGGLDMRD